MSAWRVAAAWGERKHHGGQKNFEYVTAPGSAKKRGVNTKSKFGRSRGAKAIDSGGWRSGAQHCVESRGKFRLGPKGGGGRGGGPSAKDRQALRSVVGTGRRWWL